MFMPFKPLLQTVNGWSASRLGDCRQPALYPITDKIRQVDFHGRYTASSGSALTPPKFSERILNRVNSSPANRPSLSRFHWKPRAGISLH
jgi:hypothetical protein